MISSTLRPWSYIRDRESCTGGTLNILKPTGHTNLRCASWISDETMPTTLRLLLLLVLMMPAYWAGEYSTAAAAATPADGAASFSVVVVPAADSVSAVAIDVVGVGIDSRGGGGGKISFTVVCASSAAASEAAAAAAAAAAVSAVVVVAAAISAPIWFELVKSFSGESCFHSADVVATLGSLLT